MRGFVGGWPLSAGVSTTTKIRRRAGVTRWRLAKTTWPACSTECGVLVRWVRW